jgi:HD-GYP domain-containing protein (c-di-GMP phosphodiesterase class II)
MMEIQLGDVIRMFRRMGDLHSPTTEDHAVHTSDFALCIGERIGLSAEQLRMLKFAADVHDIGKIFIDPNILYKPGKLNKAQRGQVEKHPELGYEAVELIHLPVEITVTILEHHERYDGSGYPRKLRGEQIHLFARIVAISDIWDALNSDRPYRARFNSIQALEIMVQYKSWFDPRLFAIFLEIVRGGNAS